MTRHRHRTAAIASIVIGIALGMAPVAFRMFERAPHGGEMITDFEPYMNSATIEEFRGYLATIDVGLVDLAVIRDDMLNADAAGATTFDTTYSSVAALRDTWPTIDADMTDLLDRMDRNLDNYRAVSALPPFAAFPWFFLVPGVMIAAVGVVMLRSSLSRRPNRAGWWALAALGAGLALAPVAFQMFTRAPLGGEMIDDFTPMMTVERVRDVQSHFITLGSGESQLRAALVPAATAAGVDTPMRITEFSTAWPSMLQDFNPMIATMRDNVDNFDDVAALPPFALFPWFFVVPGLIVVALAASALRRTDEPAPMPGGSQP